MKKIHVSPTDKPSRLVIDTIENKLYLQPILHEKTVNVLTQNIYITSDEEIKANVYALINGVLCKTEIKGGKIVSRQLSGDATMDICKSEYLEVILTDNTDLINDGVQAIDDEFLEWFVAHPSCERVEVSYGILKPFQSTDKGYMIHLPDNDVLEEPKQATLEEAAKNESEYLADYDDKEMYQNGFIAGALWQQEQIYNQIKELYDNENITGFTKRAYAICLDIVEQFKNK